MMRLGRGAQAPVSRPRRTPDPVRAAAHRRRRHERRRRTTACRKARSSCARRGSRRATCTSPSAPRSCGTAAGCTRATSASIDAEGYLKIVDRIKDVVKTGGEWVSSLDIEDLILRMPGVAEVAVVGVPDDKWGERPVAFVVRKADSRARRRTRSAATSQDFAERGAISKYAVPDRVHFVDAIPKTSVGKLDKKVIRAQLVGRKRSDRAHDPDRARAARPRRGALADAARGQASQRALRAAHGARQALAAPAWVDGARPHARNDRRTGRARRRTARAS